MQFLDRSDSYKVVAYDYCFLLAQTIFTLLCDFKKCTDIRATSFVSETAKLPFSRLIILISAAIDMVWNRRLKEVFDHVGRALIMRISVTGIAQRFTNTLIEYIKHHRYNINCIELFVNNGLVQFSLFDSQLSIQLEESLNENSEVSFEDVSHWASQKSNK